MSSNSKASPTVSASGGNVQKDAHVIRKNRCCTESERETIRRLNEARQRAIKTNEQRQKKRNQAEAAKVKRNEVELKREGQQCPDETVNDVSQSNEQQRREMEKQQQLREAYQRKKKACEDQMDEDYERIFIRREGLPELIHRPTNTQRRMAKQQVRTGRWRTNQKHQQAGRSIKKAAKMMMSIKLAR